MLDFVMGFGFALVIEGVLWGLFPSQLIRLIQSMTAWDEKLLRYGGVASVALGVAIIWFVQHMRNGAV